MDPKSQSSNKLNITKLKDETNDIIDSELLGEDMVLSPNDIEKKIINNNINNAEISTLGKKIMNMNFERKSSDYNFSLNDLNNFCGADRKLIINDTYEFWVHDAALISSSNYFKEIFIGNKKTQIREETISINSLPNLLSNRKKSLKKMKGSEAKQINHSRNFLNLIDADSNPNSDKNINLLSTNDNNNNNNYQINSNFLNKNIEINLEPSNNLLANDSNNNLIDNTENNKYNIYNNNNLITNNQAKSNNNFNNNNAKNKTITKTFIYVPHPDFFFDILTFIYCGDAARLALAADEPESFLSILNLGIFLEMSDAFFQALMEKCEIKISEELLSNQLWSRFSFTFDVLKSLLKLIPEEDFYLKLTACLAWLKEDNTLKRSKSLAKVQERELELLTSKEFYELKSFLAENKFLENLSIQELNKLRKGFPRLIPAFDARSVVEKFIEKSGIKIFCRICKKSSSSIQDFVKNDCEVKIFHPKSLVTLQRNLPHSCEHDACSRKMAINEFPCCHKNIHGEGCLINDNKQHILMIELVSDKKE